MLLWARCWPVRRGAPGAGGSTEERGRIRPARVLGVLGRLVVALGLAAGVIAAAALIEQQEDEFLTGYTDNYTKVYIRDFQKDIRLNEFYDVKLIGNYKDGMIAEIRV